MQFFEDGKNFQMIGNEICYKKAHDSWVNVALDTIPLESTFALPLPGPCETVVSNDTFSLDTKEIGGVSTNLYFRESSHTQKSNRYKSEAKAKFSNTKSENLQLRRQKKKLRQSAIRRSRGYKYKDFVSDEDLERGTNSGWECACCDLCCDYSQCWNWCNSSYVRVRLPRRKLFSS